MFKEDILKILVVDDDQDALEALTSLLIVNGYNVTSCSNAKEAYYKFISDSFDIVLTDIRMPEMSGIDLLEKIHLINKDIPVILITAYPDIDIAIDALRKGAYDFIVKPYKLEQLEMEKHYTEILEKTVYDRTKELRDVIEKLKHASNEMIKRLTIAGEYRDDDTGTHIRRMGLYAKELSKALKMPDDFIENIGIVAPMHDIGKVGIPDSILLKQGKLTHEEFEVMKKHTIIGANILSGSEFPLIRLAESIALNHHERFDGTGYPLGLKGNDIPIEAKIMIICDQYDALRSTRPYKKAFTHKETCEIILKGNGKTLPSHFDPDVLFIFENISGVFEDIFEHHKDN